MSRLRRVLGALLLTAGVAAPLFPSLSAASGQREVRNISAAFSDDVVASTRLGAVAFDGTMWWVGGLNAASDASVRLGLWRSTDGIRWERVKTAAGTGYGEVSDLYSIAATPEGVVAIGMATGGAHGNPRTVSWKLNLDNVLREVPAGFELYNGIRQIGVRTVRRGAAGWVIFGSRVNRNGLLGATSWTSASGDDFAIHDDDPRLSGEAGKQRQGLDVVRVGSQLIAIGEELTTRPGFIDTDGIAWISDDGASWSRWAPSGLAFGGRGDQRMQRIAALDKRLLIAGTQTVGDQTSFFAWTRTDGRWRKAVIASLGSSSDPGSNVTGVVVAPDGFYAAARVGERLRLAYSRNGRRWSTIALPGAPSGSRSRAALASNGTSIIVVARSETEGAVWSLAIP